MSSLTISQVKKIMRAAKWLGTWLVKPLLTGWEHSTEAKERPFAVRAATSSQLQNSSLVPLPLGHAKSEKMDALQTGALMLFTMLWTEMTNLFGYAEAASPN
jgi:hypothetical protein